MIAKKFFVMQYERNPDGLLLKSLPVAVLDTEQQAAASMARLGIRQCLAGFSASTPLYVIELDVETPDAVVP